MVAGQESETDYAQLRHRAYVFVAEQPGGAVSEDALVAHVFGGSGNVGLWRPLLRQVLAEEHRLRLRADGYWADVAVGRPDRDQLPREYVVLDVETTGLKPARQRLIEIAAARYVDGACESVLTTLVNPERPVPAYISRLTGIDDGLLVGAPPFRQLADEVLAFLDSALIVGFNVEFDIGFLNAELKRLGRPPLVNDRLDIMPLSNRLVPTIRRPGLDGLCRALDLEVHERHRAMADVEITAQAFQRLLDIARQQGLTSLDDLQRAAASQRPRTRPVSGVGRGRAVLDRAHLADIPRTPGVYVMHDVNDRILYVGKAKNLRSRVGSYYSQPLGYTRKMDGLLESIARIEVVETGSELAALLLESQLIRRYQPRYNTQQRRSESYPYIRVDIANPWPRVHLTRRRADDGALYFGPFRVAGAARATVDLINEIYPLRTCGRSFRTARSYGSPCLELSLGHCAGPCAGAADRDRYRQAVWEAVGFLRGERDDVIVQLQAQLAEAAERLDFERAARLRDRLRQVQELAVSRQIVDETVQGGDVLILTPSPETGARELLLIVRGRVWAQIRARADDSDGDVAWRLERAWERSRRMPPPDVDHDSLDEVQIIGRWLRKYTPHPAIVPLEPGLTDWLSFVRQVRALPDDALTFHDPSPAPEDPA